MCKCCLMEKKNAMAKPWERTVVWRNENRKRQRCRVILQRRVFRTYLATSGKVEKM